MFEIQKTILLPDIHYPHYDERVMDSVGEFIVDYQPHEIVYMGGSTITGLYFVVA